MKRACSGISLLALCLLLLTGCASDKAEAERLVMQSLEAVSLRCGDSYFLRDWIIGTGVPDPASRDLLEVKGPRIKVSPEPLTSADKANGVEFQGQVTLLCDMYRWFGATQGSWFDWSDCEADQYSVRPTTLPKYATKRNGVWDVGGPVSGWMLPDYTCESLP